jgi:transcriptional regulator GlxA family with amidase domain
MADSTLYMGKSDKSDDPVIDVTVVLLSGGLASTSLVPLEIFACAGALWPVLTGDSPKPRFRVRTAAIAGRKARSMVPVTLVPECSLEDVANTDLVFVPSAGPDLDAALQRNVRLIEWLADRRGGQMAIAGVCTGVSLLAEAGLLDGRPATTHWGFVEQYRARYPEVNWQAERIVTSSDNIFCGGGMYASIDLSLHLVELYFGHEVAVQTARALVLEAPRIWQSVYAHEPPRSTHDDDAVQRAQKWLFSHRNESVDLEALAARVGMSPRHFARRFRTATGEAPLAYLHRLRIDDARRKLESSHRSVQEIGRAVGYEDTAFFRTLFRRYTGATPKEYRERFGRKAKVSAR